MTTTGNPIPKSRAASRGTSPGSRAIRLAAAATAVLGAALTVGASGAEAASAVPAATADAQPYIQQIVQPSSVSGQRSIEVWAQAPVGTTLSVTDSFSTGTIVSVAPIDSAMACSSSGGPRVSCLEPSVVPDQQVGFTVVVRGTPAAAVTSTAEVSGLWTAFIARSDVTTAFPSTYRLSVSQTARPGPKNGQATVTATVRNSGPDPAFGITLDDLIKTAGFQGVTLTSNLPTSCPFVAPPAGYSGDLQCTLRQLAGPASWKLVFTVSGNLSAALTDTMTVDSTTIDTVNGSGSSGASTTLAPVADLAVSERVATGSAPGHADFTVVVTNNGPSPASYLTLYDIGTEPSAPYLYAIPTMATTAQNSSCFGNDCRLAFLARGQSWTVTVDFAGASGTGVGNLASISATSPPDPAPGNNATPVLYTTFK